MHDITSTGHWRNLKNKAKRIKNVLKSQMKLIKKDEGQLNF